MNPGLLDRRITIQQQAITTGATGQPIETWSTLAANLSARKQDLSGRETNRDGQEVATGTTLFTIRHRGDVSAKNRVLLGARIYEVQFVREMGRNAYEVLHTTERED